MIRRNYMISIHHDEWLKKAARDKGVSMSEILRKALDEYIAKEGK